MPRLFWSVLLLLVAALALPRALRPTEPIFETLRRRAADRPRRSGCCRPRSPRPATITGRSTAPGAPAARPRSRPTRPASSTTRALNAHAATLVLGFLDAVGRERLGLQLPARSRRLAGAAARRAEARRGRGRRRAALEPGRRADRADPPLRPPPRPGAGTPPPAAPTAAPEALDHLRRPRPDGHRAARSATGAASSPAPTAPATAGRPSISPATPTGPAR